MAPRGKKGIYSLDFWHEGQHRRRSLKTNNRKVAAERARKTLAQLDQGTYAAPPKPVSIIDAVQEYLTAKRSEQKAAKTLAAYQQELELWAETLKDYGVETLGKLTPSHFQRYMDQRRQDLAPKTIATRSMFIKSFMHWCVRMRNYLAADPLESIKVPKPRHKQQFSPSLPQVNQILDRASGDRRLQIAMLAFTGLRVGEMKMLRPQDVDRDGGFIHVPPEATGRPRPTAASARSRSIRVLSPCLGPWTRRRRTAPITSVTPGMAGSVNRSMNAPCSLICRLWPRS